jgi:hypothetical protein
MKQESSTAYSAARAPKAAAIAGIIFSLLLIVSLVIILISVPANASNNGSWLTTKGNSILFALHLVPFSGIAFLWFMGVVRDRLGNFEDRFISTVFFGSGLLFLATLFVLDSLKFLTGSRLWFKRLRMAYQWVEEDQVWRSGI